MGLLEKIKRLFGEKEATEQKTEVLYEQEPAVEKPVEPKIITVQDTGSAIKNWESTIQAAQQHPLSQVKIINTQILEELSNVLRSMDNKLEKLEKLDKLDEIIDILRRSREELASKGMELPQLNMAIEEIERLTIKDKDVIDWVAKHDKVTANQLADFINLSRSTASFRLNRLAELGALEKEALGKKIYYKIKKQHEVLSPEPSREPTIQEFA
jgi:DNA-binding transcriptional ArsR family regulator